MQNTEPELIKTENKVEFIFDTLDADNPPWFKVAGKAGLKKIIAKVVDVYPDAEHVAMDKPAADNKFHAIMKRTSVPDLGATVWGQSEAHTTTANFWKMRSYLRLSYKGVYGRVSKDIDGEPVRAAPRLG